MLRLLLVITLLSISVFPATAQYDHDTVDGVIFALYESISGPEGFEIDRETFDPLFTADARLSASYIDREGNQGFISWTPAEYIETIWNGPRQRGFFEVETHRTAEEYGNIAQIFSTYESRWNEDDEEPFQRGINSIQLMKRDGSYKIVSILWEGETANNPIPVEFLPQE